MSFCFLFQIENPRYLRQKPIPLSRVSCQVVHCVFFNYYYYVEKKYLFILINLPPNVIFFFISVDFQVKLWEEQHLGWWSGPTACTEQGGMHHSKRSPTVPERSYVWWISYFWAISLYIRQVMILKRLSFAVFPLLSANILFAPSSVSTAIVQKHVSNAYRVKAGTSVLLRRPK